MDDAKIAIRIFGTAPEAAESFLTTALSRVYYVFVRYRHAFRSYISTAYISFIVEVTNLMYSISIIFIELNVPATTYVRALTIL